MPSVTDTILIGDLSAPLAANGMAKASFFNGGNVQRKASPVLIAMVTDCLRWMQEGGNYTAQQEASVGNYLIWLCGKWGLQAASITGSGGSVTPIVPGSGAPSRVDFVVSATSYLPSGTTSATLSAFIGYNLEMIRGGISESMINSQPSYFTWNRVTGAFTCSPQLYDDEVIALIPT